MTEKDTVNIKQELKKALPFITIIILVCLANKFLIFNTTIPTSSMVSTLNIGDCLFGNRLAYIFSNPKRGDIITFKAPDDKDTIYVKRIIGIEGDTIKINNGYVWRNNELLNEEYIHGFRKSLKYQRDVYLLWEITEIIHLMQDTGITIM